jgi:hypothetical protein
MVGLWQPRNCPTCVLPIFHFLNVRKLRHNPKDHENLWTKGRSDIKNHRGTSLDLHLQIVTTWAFQLASARRSIECKVLAAVHKALALEGLGRRNRLFCFLSNRKLFIGCLQIDRLGETLSAAAGVAKLRGGFPLPTVHKWPKKRLWPNGYGTSPVQERIVHTFSLDAVAEHLCRPPKLVNHPKDGSR